MPRGIVGLVQKYWDRSVAPIELPHIRLPDAIAAGRAHRAKDHVEVSDYSAHLQPDDVAVLQYTGGTTGVLEGRDADPRQPDREHGTDLRADRRP
jgi:long-chain acyl-CoA synthetase